MASGLVTIAHNSAGPKQDIVLNQKDGFLATSPEEYAEIMGKVFRNFEEFREIREKAREKVDIFSQERFVISFQQEISKFLK